MTNVQLSAVELDLVNNREWILTKLRVIEKVYLLFGHLSEKMQVQVAAASHLLPDEVAGRSPKIARGEQYLSLPYVVLDYPRIFTKDDVFAIRTFFWWGNYFSITLHLKGSFLATSYKNVVEAVRAKGLIDSYLSTTGDEFSFDLLGDNYVSFRQGNTWTVESGDDLQFLKIGYRIPFNRWDTAADELFERFRFLLSLAENSGA